MQIFHLFVPDMKKLNFFNLLKDNFEKNIKVLGEVLGYSQLIAEVVIGEINWDALFSFTHCKLLFENFQAVLN